MAEPDAVYFAPGAGTTGRWHLYLPADWTAILQKELQGLRARYRPGDEPYWTVPPESVQSVADLLQREGLRGTGEELLVDEVLSTMTLLEINRHVGNGEQMSDAQGVKAQVQYLLRMPEETYALLHQRAVRRLRPELEPILATIPEEQLRRLIFLEPGLQALFKERNLTNRSAVREVEAVVREYAESADHLRQLLGLVQADVSPAELLARLSRPILDELAADALPHMTTKAAKHLPRPTLEALLLDPLTKMTPALREVWRGRLEDDQKSKAAEKTRAAQRRLEYKEIVAKEKVDRAERYRRNSELYPLLPELVGEVVPVYSGWAVTIDSTPLDQSKVMGYATITAATERHRNVKGAERKLAARHIIVAPIAPEDWDNRPGGELVFERSSTWITAPALNFTSEAVEYGICLEHLLRGRLRARLVRSVRCLAGTLPPDLVKYLSHAI